MGAGGARCVFCAIVAGDEPASRVWEDDAVVAFLDVHPVTRGHALVVPRRHAVFLHELADDERRRVWAAGGRVLAAARAALGCAGAHLLVNDGPAATQHVPHVHLHVVPRYGGDRLRVVAGWLARMASIFGRRHDRRALDATAARLRAALGTPP